MKTPVRDFIDYYRQSGMTRLHMPGHKGHGPLGCEAWDLTEIQGADDLADPSGILLESENNATALFGSRHTFYSTGGSSQCIKAMLYLALLHKPAGAAATVLAGRNAHKAFVHGCALLGLEPVWLWPSQPDGLCTCAVTGEDLERALAAQSQLPLAVYITAPDYLGTSPDLAALAEVCRRWGVPLLVDNAHGAYLRFLQPSRHPLDLGAAMCCDSAHKTLPVLTGGAYLHVAKGAACPFEQDARQALSVFGSSSPSYLVLASLDACNAALAGDLPARLAVCADEMASLKRRLEGQGLPLRPGEPLKLVIDGAAAGTTGLALADRLRAGGVEPEFADEDVLVLMAAADTSRADLSKVAQALDGFQPEKPRAPLALPSPGPQAMSLREAMLAPQQKVAVVQAAGRVCGSTVVSCPPAIPMAMPGERLTEETAAFLERMGMDCISVVKEVH